MSTPEYGPYQAAPEWMSPKDPAAVVEYAWDLAPWLQAGETVIARTVTATRIRGSTDPDTFAVDSTAIVASESTGAAASQVQAVVSGGIAGEVQELELEFSTDSSPTRTDVRTLRITIADR